MGIFDNFRINKNAIVFKKNFKTSSRLAIPRYSASLECPKVSSTCALANAIANAIATVIAFFLKWRNTSRRVGYVPVKDVNEAYSCAKNCTILCRDFYKAYKSKFVKLVIF